MGRLHHAALVRWANIGKLAQQIAVRPYFVFRHLSIREDANKQIERIVGECPAVIGKRLRRFGLIGSRLSLQLARLTLLLLSGGKALGGDWMGQ